jgi:hypothetical protein
MDELRQFRVSGHPGGPQETSHGRLGQGRQPQDVHAGQPGQIRHRGTPGITSALPAGDQHEQPRSGQVGRELAEQEQRRMVRPLQVLQDNEQVGGTRRAGDRIGRRGRRAEPGRGEVVRAGAVRTTATGQVVLVINADRAQYPPPRPQRRRTPFLHRTSPQHLLSVTARAVGQLFRQPCLADPRRTGQHDEPSAARQRFRPPAKQRGQLLVTPRQAARSGHRVPHAAILSRWVRRRPRGCGPSQVANRVLARMCGPAPSTDSGQDRFLLERSSLCTRAWIDTTVSLVTQ